MYNLHLKAKVRVALLLISAFIVVLNAIWAGKASTWYEGGITKLILLLFSIIGFQMAIAFTTVAILMIAHYPEATGKRHSDGSLPLWSYFVFWPWQVVHLVWMQIQRRGDKEKCPIITEVAPNLLLGGYPGYWGFCSPCQIDSILDCTCELPGAQNPEQHYFCVPTWDGMAPTASQIGLAVDWALEQRKMNRTVLIHCFHGVGRSATVMCAVLAKLGICPGTDQALNHLRKIRPIVKLQDYHLRELAEWAHIDSMRTSAASGHF